jgi:hypothetical protein
LELPQAFLRKAAVKAIHQKKEKVAENFPFLKKDAYFIL